MEIMAIRKQFARVEERAAKLNSHWLERAGDATLYALPVRAEGEDPDREIVPARVAGDDAKRLACTALTTFTWQGDQAVKATPRFPGTVAVTDPDPMFWYALLKAKLDLKALFAGLTRRRRTELRAQALPAVSLLQAYRRVVLLPRTPHRIDFTWVANTQRSQRVTRQEMLTLLEDRPASAPRGREERVLNSVGEDAYLVLRRPLPPKIQVMVFYDPTRSRPDITLSGNLPLFYPAAAVTPRIRHLPAFKPHENVRAKRRDRDVVVPVIPQIGLYVVERHGRAKREGQRKPQK